MTQPQTIPLVTFQDLLNIEAALFVVPSQSRLQTEAPSKHPPPKVQELRELATWNEGMVWTPYYDRVVDVMEDLMKRVSQKAL